METGWKLDGTVQISLSAVSRRKRRPRDGRRAVSYVRPETGVRSHVQRLEKQVFRVVWRNEVAFHSFAVEFLGVTIAHFKLVEQDVMIDDKVAFSHLRHGYRSIQLYARCSTRTALLPGNVPRQD